MKTLILTVATRETRIRSTRDRLTKLKITKLVQAWDLGSPTRQHSRLLSRGATKTPTSQDARVPFHVLYSLVPMGHMNPPAVPGYTAWKTRRSSRGATATWRAQRGRRRIQAGCLRWCFTQITVGLACNYGLLSSAQTLVLGEHSGR